MAKKEAFIIWSGYCDEHYHRVVAIKLQYARHDGNQYMYVFERKTVDALDNEVWVSAAESREDILEAMLETAAKSAQSEANKMVFNTEVVPFAPEKK